MMDRLVSPRSVAIVGLSADPTKHGARVLANMRKLGFEGEIWGVNPKLPDVAGVDVFASVADLPDPPDVMVLVVPAALVPPTVRASAGAGYAIVFAGGFAERGPAGDDLQDELVAAGHESGVRILGPNSGGVIVPGARVAMSFLTCLDRPADQIRSGPVGLVTQSGGTGSYLHNLAAARGGGLAASISTGNEAGLGVADGISALAAMDGVRVISLILETVRDGPAFATAVRDATKAGKRLVMTRIGTSAIGRTMTQSHTGALATPARVLDAVCDAFGIATAETPEEMFEMAEILARVPKPGGDRVGIVTHSGGVAILLSDLAERARLELPSPSSSLQRSLEPLLELGSAGNPLDMGGIIGGPHRFGEVVDAFAHEYDAVLAVSSAHPAAHTEARVESLLAVEAPAPVVHLWMAGDVGAHGLARLRTAGRPVTEEPRAAIRALRALTRTLPGGLPSQLPAAAMPLPARPTNEWAAKQIIRSWGIPTVEGQVAATATDAVRVADRLGYPVVAKISSASLAHKTEIGGVLTGLSDAAAVEAAHHLITERASSVPSLDTDGVLIERMVDAGVEIVVGVVGDRVFGPMVLVGLGGMWAESLDDVALAPAPVSAAAARALIERLSGYAALRHPRRGAATDIDSLADIVSRVSVGASTSSATAIEMNPLAWTKEGWMALDAVITMNETAGS